MASDTSTTNISAAKRWKVLVIGGSYAGLSSVTNLIDLCEGKVARCAFPVPTEQPKSPRVDVEITIVEERDGYYHLIGSPLALAESKYASKAWVRYQDVPALQHQSISFVQGTVEKVDCESKTASIMLSGSTVPTIQTYDFLVAASGYRRVWPVVPQALERKAYLEEAHAHIHSVHSASKGVVVIGGGAVGIEMAAEIKLIQPNLKVTLIHSRDELLSSEPLPSDFKQKTLEVLRDQGVETILGQRVVNVQQLDNHDYCLTLSSKEQVIAGHVISAISTSVPTSTYLQPQMLDTEGLVKIQPTLMFATEMPNAEHHFAAGDLAACLLELHETRPTSRSTQGPAKEATFRSRSADRYSESESQRNSTPRGPSRGMSDR